MASYFNIFNESENRFSSSLNKENSKVLSSSKLKSVGNVSLPPAKIIPSYQNKPKGLSIRSKSDLNVVISNKPGGVKLNSKECLKLQPEQCFTGKPTISPIKIKTPKSKSFASITTKKLSPKISSPIMQNVVDNFVFTKPTTPKKFPESELLCYDFDQYKYMDEEMERIFDEDRQFLRSNRKQNDSIESLEDEGFISDMENYSFNISSSDISSLSPLNDVQLPDISDSENDSSDNETEFHSALASLSIELPDISDCF